MPGAFLKPKMSKTGVSPLTKVVISGYNSMLHGYVATLQFSNRPIDSGRKEGGRMSYYTFNTPVHLSSRMFDALEPKKSYASLTDNSGFTSFCLFGEDVGYLFAIFNFAIEEAPVKDRAYVVSIRYISRKKEDVGSHPYKAIRFKKSVEPIETDSTLYFVSCDTDAKVTTNDFEFGFVPDFMIMVRGVRSDVCIFATTQADLAQKFIEREERLRKANPAEEPLVELPKRARMQGQKVLGHLLTGETVVDRPRSHISEGAKAHLEYALSQIEGEKTDLCISVEVDFGYTIGMCNCVETGPDDEIVYARRRNRDKLKRFVIGREPEPSSWLSIGLNRDPSGYYYCITAYIGRASSEKGFWNNHAIVLGTVEIFPESITYTRPKEY